MSVRNKKKRIVIVLFGAVLISTALLVAPKVIRRKWERDKREYLLEQERLKQELEPFMEEARSVMRGEKMAAGEMALYNYYEYQDVTAVEADADIVVADIDGDEGIIVVEYHIDRLNKEGKAISREMSLGTIWKIKKENGNWILVAIPSPEGSEEEVEEVEKLTKKLRKYGEISD